MRELFARLQEGVGQAGIIIPAFLAAAAILFTGYLLARQIERWSGRALRHLNFNRVADAGGITSAVHRTGTGLDPAHAIGKLLFWLVMLIVILLSSTALGLESISDMFGTILTFVPTLLTALVIVILGMIVGEFLRGLLLASAGAVAGVPLLAKVSKVAVVTIAVFMALQHVGVAGEIVTSAFTLILGAIALATGLAFGLGNRELAGEITRRWYEGTRSPSTDAADDPAPTKPES